MNAVALMVCDELLTSRMDARLGVDIWMEGKLVIFHAMLIQARQLYCKIPKYSDTQKITVIILKF